MKLNVITDKMGNIVGSAKVSTEAGLIPQPEQTMHEIEVSDDLMKSSAVDFHQHISDILHPKLTGLRALKRKNP